MTDRCSDVSRARLEPVSATAATALRWLLLEVRGSWPRDVATGATLPEGARAHVSRWLAADPGPRRLLFVRRPRRSSRPQLVFVVESTETAGELRRIELGSDTALEGIDLDAAGERVDRPLVLVCGHGSRDTCCSLRGAAVFGALEGRLGEEEVWMSSHHGGHRFAANVLVLPAGLHFGRVEPDEAPFLVARALAGRIQLDRYRGRTCYEPTVQAAEHAVRAAAGLDGVDELRLAGVHEAVVRFRTWDGSEHSVAVGEVHGPIVPSSCGAEPEPQPRLVGRLV